MSDRDTRDNESFELWWENKCASAIRVFVKKADARYIYNAAITACQKKCGNQYDFLVTAMEELR